MGFLHSLDREVRLRLLGGHQVDNGLAAVAVLASVGVDVSDAAAGIEATDLVPEGWSASTWGNRSWPWSTTPHNVSGQGRLLPFLRSLTAGRVIVVLGATGGRDPGKRAALGRIVGAEADLVVVTDESAYGDDPVRLREAVAAGARQARRAEVLVEADRARAIGLAVAAADHGDVVLVAGRGADQVQVRSGHRRAFDDRVVLRRAAVERAAVGYDAYANRTRPA